jgi:predicted RNA polymerase sigma factor
VPTPQELPERLGAVLQVIYLVFNEGYSAAAGAEVTRAELTGEAIRLGRLLTELRPEPEVIGLLSLMLIHESRRAARTSPTGELILLVIRAVAIAMCDGPEAGLTLIDAVLEHGEFANYYLAHSARADMYRRLGRTAEAQSSYEKALALTQQEPERQFLQERIRQLKKKDSSEADADIEITRRKA